MRFSIPTPYLIVILTFILFSSCHSRKVIPEDIENHLNEMSEKERLTFERLLEHYASDNDSLKLKSCYFLINNMPGIGSMAVDKQTNKIVVHKDMQYITTGFLIEQIDEAVSVCQEKLADGSLGFNDFCNYILPYRINYEPLENWRKMVSDRYHPVIDSIGKHKRLEDTTFCKVFNNLLKDGFKYKSEGNFGEIKNWSALSVEKAGNCAEMCKTVLFPLRAFGVPVTIDFTPCWANSNGGGHQWNVLLVNGKNSLPFMGLEADPVQYNPLVLYKNEGDPVITTYRRSGKIYRRQFEININSLPAINASHEETPEELSDYHIKDVTREYAQVTDIPVHFSSPLFHGQHIAYLGVFANGAWRVSAFASIDQKGVALFKDMAREVMYMPMLLSNHDYQPSGTPVYADSAGNLRLLQPADHAADIAVVTVKSKESEQLSFMGKNSYLGWESVKFKAGLREIAEGKQRAVPETGKAYTLYYWKDKWAKIGTIKKGGAPLVFSHVPANGLYRLTTDAGDGQERCFSVVNGEQQWW